MRLMLNTCEVPEHERLDYWRSAKLHALTATCRVEPISTKPFSASMGVMAFGPMTLIDISGTAYRVTREGPAADGCVSFMFQISGVGAVTDQRRLARLTPGDVCLVPPDRDVVTERASDFRQLLLKVKTRQLDEAWPGWRDLTTLTIEAARPRVRSACELLRFALTHRGELDASCRERLSATTLTLLGGLLEGAGDDAATAPSAGHSRLAHFHRQRIERYIDDNLRDPELSVARIAQDLGLSTRYVHKLFETEPVNVMQRAMSQRLRDCHRDVALRGPRSISEVAYSWGFNSPAHFSRVFKKHFGVCPSEL
jgi:AraC-like DNA-binding protein